MENKFVQIPQPHELSIREKEDAMGAYLMMFAALAVGLPFPILNLVAALIYYYVNRSKGRFVHFHLLQSLYSQIPTTLLNVVLVGWTVRILFFDFELTSLYWGYLSMDLLANLFYFAFSIIAAIKSRKGQLYYFIFFGKIAYTQVFSKSNSFYQEKELTNKPPTL